MNIHNHSLWPPPGDADLHRPVLAAGCGAWPPPPACAPLIAPATLLPCGGHAAVIPPMDKR